MRKVYLIFYQCGRKDPRGQEETKGGMKEGRIKNNEKRKVTAEKREGRIRGRRQEEPRGQEENSRMNRGRKK
jgi:hypothetical protein